MYFQVSISILSRVRSPPKRLKLDFGADRKWKEKDGGTPVTNEITGDESGMESDNTCDVFVEPENTSMIQSISVMPECNWCLESCLCGINDHTLYAIPRHKLVAPTTVIG